MKYLLDCLLHVDPMVPFLKPPFSLLETKFLVDLYTVPKNCSDKIVTSSWHHRERDITPRRHMNG